MKVAAFLIDEICDVKHSYGYWDDKKKEWIKGHDYALYYGAAVVLLRQIIEVLAQLKLYTRRWKTADILVLLSGVCTCCDGNMNMFETIKFVREQGFKGTIIAATNATTGERREFDKLENVVVISRKCQHGHEMPTVKAILQYIHTLT